MDLNQFQEQNKENKLPQQNNQFAFKLKLFKISVIILCLPICILVIYVLSISVDYFSFLFSLTSQNYARAYLSQYYASYMALLYISIIGFVIIISNTIVFQFQFSQKSKVVYLHVIYFLTFLISGIVNRTLTQYNTNMELLTTYNVLSANCTTRTYVFQCNLSITYVEYNSKMLTFFIVKTIFVLIYIVVYHLAAIYELKDLQVEQKVSSVNSVNSVKQISYQNKNESFISQVEFN